MLWITRALLIVELVCVNLVLSQTPSDPKTFRPSPQSSTIDAFGNSSLSFSQMFSGANHLVGLFTREQTCGYPVPCDGDQWCCPAGSKCCSTILGCCLDGYECRTNLPDGKNCCLDISETCGGEWCAPPGTVCCSDYVCPEGMTCNELGGQNCCQTGEMKCEDACCPEGSTCAPEAGYCQWTKSSTQTPTQTKTSESTVTKPPTTSAVTRTSIATSTATDECVPGTEKRFVVERGRFPKYCTELCNLADGKQYPVWEIKSIPGETDQLIYSMCQGINARVAAGTIQSGLADGDDILSYNGPDVKNKADCDGFCADLNKDADNTYPSREYLECDEYPPASFNPIGGSQTRVCIPSAQNSRTQGPMLSRVLANCGITKQGQKMMVRIVGGCSQFPMKRGGDEISLLGARDTTIQLEDYNSTLRNPNGDGSLLYVGVGLGELADGHYNLKVNFNGTIDNVTVLNAFGEEYARVDTPSGQTSLSFDVSGGSNLPLALIAWTGNVVNVTYTGTGDLTKASTIMTSIAPTATSTIANKSGSTKKVFVPLGLVFTCFMLLYLL